MKTKNKLIWKSEEGQLRYLEREKETRDGKKYGRDGYILSAEGEFIYQGVSYLIKVLRYYNFDDGFTNISRERISDSHAVVEYPKETKPIVDLVLGVEGVYDFLFHDTLHSFNDKQNIEEQIKQCHKWAKEDIDSLFSGEISDKLDEAIKKLQDLKSKFKKLVKGIGKKPKK